MSALPQRLVAIPLMWALFPIVVSTGFAGAAKSAAWSDTCASSKVAGLDTSYIDTYSDIYLQGEASGETFFAPYTEIVSITLWRPVFQQNNGAVWRIFIMGVDSLGVPDVNSIIQDGPTLSIPYGDGVHPTPFKFVFAPPVQLPSVGEYELAVQGDQCAGVFDIAGDSHDDYPGGIYWFHRREDLCEYRPRSHPSAFADEDMVFQIEFCVPETPVRRSTWGSIKALYR